MTEDGESLRRRSPLDIDDGDVNWIVQVSDLHFSKFRDPRRPADFEVRNSDSGFGFCYILQCIIK